MRNMGQGERIREVVAIPWARVVRHKKGPDRPESWGKKRADFHKIIRTRVGNVTRNVIAQWR